MLTTSHPPQSSLSPTFLFLAGIGIPLIGALLFAFISRLPVGGSIAALSLGLLALIAILVIALIAIHISTIRNAEQLLKQHSDELTVILASIGEGLLVIDSHERITLLNPAAEHMLGISLDRASRPHIASVISCTQQGKPLAIRHTPPIEALHSQAPIKTMLYDDICIQGANGPIPVIGVASPLNDEQGIRIGSVWIFRNVTAEKRIDENKAEFVSLASHQLKTPLTIINWYSELLLTKGGRSLKGDLRMYAERISKGGIRMVSLINELLTVTQIEEGRIRPAYRSIDIAKAIRNVVDECNPIVDKLHGAITFQAPAKPLILSIDPTLFSQSLLNIIMNAVNYSDPLSCDIHISVRAQKNGPCRVIVHDTGIGIPEDAKEHIFEKFYRARNAIDAQSDGNGLGLYIAKRFLEYMDGDLTFESQERKGTTFTIALSSHK